MNFLHLFEPKCPLNHEDEAWQLEAWLWLLKHLGGLARLRKSPVVAPTDAFFPVTDAKHEKLAEYVFSLAKKHAGLDNVVCKLVVQPETPPLVDGPVPLATFKETDGQVTISYDPDIANDAFALVSTFAHELSHYLIAHANDALPGGTDMLECLTDLTTVFLGFGIFGADCAFNLWKEPGGSRTGGAWHTSTMGYLRELDWVYALAVFVSLRGESPEILRNWLKPALYSEVKGAAVWLAANPGKLDAHRRIL